MTADIATAEALLIKEVSKGYPGVQALNRIGLSVRAGAIHAIAGQNGAGKTTLVKILSGAEAPDSGSIQVGGQRVRFHGPQDAQAAGIQAIYQELSLVPQLSVAENVLLGHLPRRRFPGVDWADMRRQAEQALALVGLELDVRQPVSRFSVAEQQGVEIAKALHRNARILLLDEPTSALPAPDVQRLFSVLRNLAHNGMTLLYISHRIEELFELCESVTVLRNGQKAGTYPTAASSAKEVVEAMLGKELTGSLEAAAVRGERSARLGSGPTASPLMSVTGIAEEGKLSGITFDLHEGEVLGLAGLVGSGQSELAGVLGGARKPSAGRITLDGRELKPGSPQAAIRAGIGLLPQDRKAQGIIPDLSVAANITLASLPRFSRLGVRDRKRETRTARALAERLDMRIAGVSQPMRTLSGGTQQKAILARWLVRSIRVLICDEPTRGVDVGAREEIYELIRDFARAGGTVVLASSELSEVMMCDRVLAMARGRIVGELAHDEIDEHGKAIIERFS